MTKHCFFYKCSEQTRQSRVLVSTNPLKPVSSYKLFENERKYLFLFLLMRSMVMRRDERKFNQIINAQNFLSVPMLKNFFLHSINLLGWKQLTVIVKTSLLQHDINYRRKVFYGTDHRMNKVQRNSPINFQKWLNYHPTFSSHFFQNFNPV